MELICNSLLKRAKWCVGLGFGLLEKERKDWDSWLGS
jgi:hypothetical protein